MRGRSLQQLITFFQLELHGRLVPEDPVSVDARAVEVEDVLNRVTHVIHGLRGVFEGRLKDFSENVRAYPRGLLLDGLYMGIVSYCREST